MVGLRETDAPMNEDDMIEMPGRVRRRESMDDEDAPMNLDDMIRGTGRVRRQ